MEVAFPQSGISRVIDGWVLDNEEAMSKLQDASMYNEACSWGFLSGSRPESLAMDDGWGHDEADWDCMYMYGGQIGVHVPGGQQSRGEACLEFCPEDCPSGYTKLGVTDLHGLRQHHKCKDWIEEGVHRSGGKSWLSTFQAVRGMKDSDETISGPAAQDGTRDYVTTLVCNGPHPHMYQEFLNRARQWPPVSLISVLLKLPMLLVLVGHKLSPESNLQARISWSHLELKLIQELPLSVCQGYIACKYVLKRFLKVHRGQNEAGKGRVCSFHFKTAFLRHLEKTPPKVITSPFQLFLDLLHDLNEYIKVRKLPHYFLAQCNLLETVADDELCIATQAIQKILSDPMNAILTSPSYPKQIYGEVRPDYLVVKFIMFSSHPECKQSREDLSELLSRVDDRRRQKYTEQLEKDEDEDEYYRVSGRVEPTGLVDSFQ